MLLVQEQLLLAGPQLDQLRGLVRNVLVPPGRALHLGGHRVVHGLYGGGRKVPLRVVSGLDALLLPLAQRLFGLSCLLLGLQLLLVHPLPEGTESGPFWKGRGVSLEMKPPRFRWHSQSIQKEKAKIGRNQKNLVSCLQIFLKAKINK